MARKRVFLDECLDPDLARVFGPKDHVYTARDLGVTGKQDTTVIDKAVRRKCLIVTCNKDFVRYYRRHPLRQGSRLPFFYGMIFLGPTRILTRQKQLRRGLQEIAWDETRRHDDLVTVLADGSTRHERLCHPECAKEFAKT